MSRPSAVRCGPRVQYDPVMGRRLESEMPDGRDGPGGAVIGEPAGRFSPVVVAPSYNNARTVLDVLRRIAGTGLPVIVVDDGCTDATFELLNRWHESERLGDAVRVLRHPRNLGKAQGLL